MPIHDTRNHNYPNLPYRVERIYRAKRDLSYFYTQGDADQFIDAQLPILLKRLTSETDRPQANFRIEASTGYAIVTDSKQTKVYISLKRGTTYSPRQ